MRTALWKYAERHNGAFPSSIEEPEIPATTWQSIDPAGLRLIYVPGQKADSGKNIVAYEPGSFGAKRFVLLADGEISEMPIEQLTMHVTSQIKAMDAELTTRKP